MPDLRLLSSFSFQVSAFIPLDCLTRTLLAEAIENDLMIRDSKSRRSEFF